MQNVSKKNKGSKKVGRKALVGASAPKRPGMVPAGVSFKQSGSITPDHLVSGREYMFSLSGNSSSFLLLGLSGTFPGYDLNPGNRVMFPWLSLVACAYEKYRFELLEFEIVPRNPTTVSGAVYSALDYDWDDTPASSAAELMSNKGAVSSDVWTPHVMRVDARRLNEDVPWRYVADLPRTESSQRLTYGGFLMIAIAGTTVPVSFDVFVQYKIRLSLPALHAVDSSAIYTFTSPVVIGAGSTAAFPGLPAISGISSVVSGIGGIPLLAGYPSGTPAYRVGVSGRGELSLTAKPATAGSPPSAFVTDTSLDAAITDASGVVLDYLSSIASSISAFAGPDTPGTWATNGAVGKSSVSVSMAALRRLVPLAAYLVPRLISTAGRTLSTATTLSARYTEL